MGANDKKRAAFNTWPQIPETADIRDAWIRSETSDNPFDQRADIEAEFDCWLEQVKAEAKAEVLTNLAEEAERNDSWDSALWIENESHYMTLHDWLRKRAEQIRGT